MCGVCDGPCPFWNVRACLPLLRRYYHGKRGVRRWLRSAVRRHRSIYRYIAASAGVRFLVDSSKNVAWHRAQLRWKAQWRGVQPTLLYLARDGRAVVNSYLRKYPERTIASVTQWWMRDKVERDQLWKDFPGPRYRMRYEDLAQNPSVEIRKLCAFLGVSFQPAMIDFWNFDHHLIGGNRVTRSQLNSDVTPGSWHTGYYDGPPTIRLDLRWREELAPDAQEHFERYAGALNRELRFEGLGC